MVQVKPCPLASHLGALRETRRAVLCAEFSWAIENQHNTIYSPRPWRPPFCLMQLNFYFFKKLFLARNHVLNLQVLEVLSSFVYN